MNRKLIILVCIAACPVILFPILAQDKQGTDNSIETALAEKKFSLADSLLQQKLHTFINTGQLDTIAYYVPFAGRIANAQLGTKKAVSTVFALTDQLKKKDATPATLVNAYRSAAEFFSEIGQYQAGYDASIEALNATMQSTGDKESEIARCEYNLGVYAHRLGNVALSHRHHRQAMIIRQASKKTDPEDIYLSANAMGGLMWYASKYDSATLLFNMALDALTKMPGNDVNRYFRTGNIQNNLAALYSADGKTSEAIKAMQVTIANFQRFILSTEPGAASKKQSATEGLYEAIDNLAGIYKELSDFGKMGELLHYSYQQKKQKLDSDHPGIFISEILLGQYYKAMHEYDSSMYYLQSGLARVEKTGSDYLFWAADAYFTKAMIHENRRQYDEAAASYAKSEELYEQSYQGQYDNVYMDFLRGASLFYAKNGDYNKAFERADKVYKYLVAINEERSLQGFYQLLNIAELNYLTKRYREAIHWSDKAVSIAQSKMKDGNTMLDSVKIDILRPKAILISAKSAYDMQVRKDSNFLVGLSARLDEALRIMGRRKTVINDQQSINILIADHQELIDFAKKIELELARLSGTAYHYDRLINLQESALYSRIRSRLDKQQALLFTGIPVQLQEQEHSLKNAITQSLLTSKPNEESINEYIAATHRWEEYLNKVKNEYPAYYSMRYETIVRTLPDLQVALPDSTTVVRYFFVDSSLMAFVIDKKSKTLVELKNNQLESKVNAILAEQYNEKALLPLLHSLYSELWQPLSSLVKNNRVTIVPDGILFNLNFEMLTPKPVGNFRELAANSLLSKNTLSYHYSLFMLADDRSAGVIQNNYVAFAPGFTDEVKKKYLSATTDSATLDYRYLKLLPQPATNKLARKMGGLFSGNTYLDDASTRNSFQQNAGGHKIIHIGTHASFDNVHPEQSGLIFAKSSKADSNFLSLFDIYGCNMQSNLTILTACESGKPGYQDGEGMVSLAHAFKYAGSQRILTALWKIDEQSSSKITELFILNLKKGLATDEALRNAKLQYLQEAEGRVAAPTYWAGLVMIGEPYVLQFEKDNKPVYWILASIAMVAALTAVAVTRRRKARSSISNRPV